MVFSHKSFVLAWFLRIKKHNVVWVSQSILLQLLPMRTHCIHLLRYTENPSYQAHQLFVRQSRTFHSIINALPTHSITCTLFQIHETFFPEYHLGLIWIQTVFENVKRERETGACRNRGKRAFISGEQWEQRPNFEGNMGTKPLLGNRGHKRRNIRFLWYSGTRQFISGEQIPPGRASIIA